jgi:hypothetical protein
MSLAFDLVNLAAIITQRQRLRYCSSQSRAIGSYEWGKISSVTAYLLTLSEKEQPHL